MNEEGADYFERASQAKMQPVLRDSFEKNVFCLQETIWSDGTEQAYIHHSQPVR